MKRILAIIMAVMLLGASALGEVRDAVIWLEGFENEIEETRYDSPLGFSLWYDADALEVEADISEDGDGLTICPMDTDLPIWLEIMTAESVGMLPSRFLALNAAPDTEYEEDVTEDGSPIHWFSKFGDDGYLMETYFAVDGDESALVAVGCWPYEAEEGWGVWLRRVMMTISFAPAPPVRASWTEWASEADGELLVVDEDGEYVAFIASEAVTDFRLTSLDLTGVDAGGAPTFESQVLYERDELEAWRPFVAKLAFPGDIPGYGIEYTDAEGNEMRCAVSISGRDGSLILSEF